MESTDEQSQTMKNDDIRYLTMKSNEDCRIKRQKTVDWVRND